MLTLKRLFSALMVTALFLSLSVTAFAANYTPLGKVTLMDQGKVMFELNGIEYKGSDDLEVYFAKQATVKFGKDVNSKYADYYSTGLTEEAYWSMEGAAALYDILTDGEITLTKPGTYSFHALQLSDDVNAGYPPEAFFLLIINPDLGDKPFKGPEATKTAAGVVINGAEIAFDAYTVNDNNYFKIRDLAAVVSGTSKHFNVGYDTAMDAIIITTGQDYVDGDGIIQTRPTLNYGAPLAATAVNNPFKVYVDGKEVSLTAYNIQGCTYFKLRDVGQVVNFGVDWDNITRSIQINTEKNYVSE